MILYLDTSALIKRYITEPGSKEITVMIKQAEAVGSTLLTQVEMASALAKAVRMDWVESHDAKLAWQEFLSHWESFAQIPVTVGLMERATQIAWEYGLRGYDATHFASALIWQELVEIPVTLATFDRELWLAAKKAGMAVWPESFS